MTDHKIGTRTEWQAARDELAKLEAAHAEHNAEIKRRRLELPWVPVEKEYEFETEAGRRTLADLFEGRSQLLAYNIMFGPDYELGACPGCSSLVDHLDAAALHLGHRDVTLILFSRAPIDRLVAYKRRMGWQLPYVSTYGTDFPFDFGLALTKEQARETPEITGILDAPPEWLQAGGNRSARSSRTASARTRAGLRSLARMGPSITLHVSRPTRSLLPTTRSYRSGRRRVPTTPSRDRGARTSTRLDRCAAKSGCSESLTPRIRPR